MFILEQEKVSSVKAFEQYMALLIHTKMKGKLFYQLTDRKYINVAIGSWEEGGYIKINNVSSNIIAL